MAAGVTDRLWEGADIVRALGDQARRSTIQEWRAMSQVL